MVCSFVLNDSTFDALWRQTQSVAQPHNYRKLSSHAYYTTTRLPSEFDALWRQTQGVAQYLQHLKAVKPRLLYHTEKSISIFALVFYNSDLSSTMFSFSSISKAVANCLGQITLTDSAYLVSESCIRLIGFESGYEILVEKS